MRFHIFGRNRYVCRQVVSRADFATKIEVWCMDHSGSVFKFQATFDPGYDHDAIVDRIPNQTLQPVVTGRTSGR